MADQEFQAAMADLAPLPWAFGVLDGTSEDEGDPGDDEGLDGTSRGKREHPGASSGVGATLEQALGLEPTLELALGSILGSKTSHRKLRVLPEAQICGGRQS